MPDPNRPMPLSAVIAGIISLAMIGAWLKWGPAYVPFAAAGGLGLALIALVVPLTSMLSRTSGARTAQTLRDEVAALSRSISQMSEQNALSDDARRVLNRKRERELLRAAIEE